MDNNNNIYLEVNDRLVFHPASFVKDAFEDMGISRSEFAKRLETSEKNLSELFNGKIDITVNMARKLENVTNVSSGTWLNLQNEYSVAREELKELDNINEQLSILDFIDYSSLVKRGYLVYTRKRENKVKKLCTLLKTNSLKTLTDANFAIDFRPAPIQKEREIINSNIWIELVSRSMEKEPLFKLNKEKLKESIDNLRELTLLEPKQFIPKVKNILNDCGIHFILMPSFKNAKPKGMVMWKHDQVTLAMSNKGKYSDIFWFTFFHELGHILLHPQMDFIDFDDNSLAKREKEADSFASEILIPESSYKQFIENNSYTIKNIDNFARENHIERTIVIGRLQKDKLLEYHQLTRYKKKFIWDFES